MCAWREGGLCQQRRDCARQGTNHTAIPMLRTRERRLASSGSMLAATYSGVKLAASSWAFLRLKKSYQHKSIIEAFSQTHASSAALQARLVWLKARRLSQTGAAGATLKERPPQLTCWAPKCRRQLSHLAAPDALIFGDCLCTPTGGMEF